MFLASLHCNSGLGIHVYCLSICLQRFVFKFMLSKAHVNGQGFIFGMKVANSNTKM